MGCISTVDEATKNIDKFISNDKYSDKNPRVLILGTGDSGKSTFLRQLQIINGDFEINSHKWATVLRSNSLSSCQLLLRHVVENNPEIENEEYKTILQAATLTEDMGKNISRLWKKDTLLKEAWEKRSENNIPAHEMAYFYLKNAQKFSKDDFEPTLEEILRAKQRTLGINEITITWEEKGKISLIDVGGQRSERRKWLHCFDNIDTIIFIAALDEYDLPLQEDPKVNRLVESLSLFERITSFIYFQSIPFILFFNKSDAIEKKLKSSPLKNTFKDYKGKSTDDAILFLAKKYFDRFKGKIIDNNIYVTCALDRDNIYKIFNGVTDSILVKSLYQNFYDK